MSQVAITAAEVRVRVRLLGLVLLLGIASQRCRYRRIVCYRFQKCASIIHMIKHFRVLDMRNRRAAHHV